MEGNGMRWKICAAVFSLFLILASAALGQKALVRVYFDDMDHARSVLGEFGDVAGRSTKRFAEIVVPSERMGELKALAPRHEVLIADVDQYVREQGIMDVGSAYHTYEETNAEMDSIAAEHPGICMVDSVGTTHEGRTIYGIKVSDNVGTTEDEPRVIYIGCHHAREIITVEIPLYILYHLVDNYGVDPRITDLIDNREIWIIPLLNPDGREYVQHTGDWRKNRRNNGDGTYGVDINRNYGYMWGYDDQGSSSNTSSEVYRGPSAFSEPETQAIRDFCETYQFSTGISYHSHGNLVIYPWGYDYVVNEEADVFQALADSMASFNNYYAGPITDLYPANGGTDDWMWGERATKDKVYFFTFEVGEEFYPPESSITGLCEENLEASLVLADYAGGVSRILPPPVPVIASIPDDEDGNYTVSWSTPDPDTVNPAVKYSLVERSGASKLLDDAESGFAHWVRKKFNTSSSRYHSAATSFYGGQTNDRNATLTSLYGLDVDAGDTLRFWTWYDIETNWDYAYVEISTDGGTTFRSIPGNITTTYNPNGNNAGHGITGSSGGWIEAVFPLGAAADSTVTVRFRYKTDSYVLEEGIYVDDMFPVQEFDSSAVLSDNITETEYEISGRAVGIYYYEVMACDAEGQWSALSQRESVEVLGSGVPHAGDAQDAVIFRNPVRAGEIVRFAPVSGGNVLVRIVDVRGRAVARVEVTEDGAEWDQRDINGSFVSPGIYFVRYEVAGKKAAGKLVVLR
jgi:hypothetical protein